MSQENDTSMGFAGAQVEEVDPKTSQRLIPDLAELLISCVEDGAGIGFVLPLSRQKAEAFWSDRCRDISVGKASMLVIKEKGRVVATVTLLLAQQDNGGHRAEVSKLMVHPDHRRKGLALKLMQAVDKLAHSHDRWLLVLDTVTGDRAEKLYPKCGYKKVGVIPNFAYNSHGNLDATSVFYKDLRG